MVTGSNLDGVRRANLAAILHLVHRSGGLSRSELTARTGLNRSTIAALVGELSELGLVVERSPEATRRVGRPSPLVVASQRPVAVAVNPELDAVTVAVVGLSANVEQRVRHEVDHVITAEETVEIVAGILSDRLAPALAARTVLGVGFAVPGLVRVSDSVVRWAPHLEWTDVPIAQLMTRSTGLPSVAGNDASLGAVAERLFGAGRGVDDLIYLNGGASGIGGGVIVGGRSLGGVSGYAGEFGQNRPGLRRRADRVTADGVLEDEVSRARLLERLGLGHADEDELSRLLLASEDASVIAELARQRTVLSAAIGNAVNVLNPELVILGGFLAAVHASDPDDMAARVADHVLSPAWEDVAIRDAGLASDRLLIGAAELAFAELLADPAGVVAATA